MSDDQKISELLLLWDEARQRGQPVPAEDLCGDCQELLPEVQRRIAALQELYHVLAEDTNDPLPPKPTKNPAPQCLGRYRVTGRLGAGGFGVVYKARDEELRRDVAIKVPHRQRLANPKDADAFLVEAQLVASLDHPHIVPVLDLGRTADGQCYVVSKFIEGGDLNQRLQQMRFSFARAAELVATVAEALHYAHGRGLVHRDVKPGNILLDGSDKAYVADFGLALKEADFGKEASFAGTPAYMSPEQARGEGHRVDGRSDIFSLGVVFYQILTGRLPFRGDSLHEVLQQITRDEARPPRQLDDAIPKELERICLKGLAKRTTDRYTTAKDMAADLRYFLAHAAEEEKSRTVGVKAGAETPAAPTPVAGKTPTPTSDLPPVKIVPKGLRAFDAHDADFFLELLPGPRDRDGLPDSLRFWKTRIEEIDPDSTFAVGLLYGPSGCGKTSLVKAGLLPRLAGPVIAVYVEANADDTETRLLKGLRKHCPEVPAALGLIETLAALRSGFYRFAGTKVVLILDQFEQWLHARGGDANTELVQALRHCDGGGVQCLVLVRDDFGMAATRFMGALDIPILQGHNFATVDLFDLLHARKVLAEFGRAFDRLPDNLATCTKEQEAFLDRAVSGLAQEGKVISVRLALFADMVKGKSWTPATLRAVGGMEGVGVTFLEETFTAATAPPQHRLHQKAVQAVLRALLPDLGTDIKGNMRSQQELLEASGYAGQPKDFDALLRILDGELRLITPTDPGGKEEAKDLLAGRASDGSTHPSLARPANEFTRYYQLTHDYLVPSLQDWLTRKQKETPRGRAELLLADRAAVWNARPENPQLPSLWQWASIRWFTQPKHWTPPQRKMMGQASRYHAMRGIVVVVLLAAATFTGSIIRDQVEEKQNETHAKGLVQAVLNANTVQVPGMIYSMAKYRKWTDPLLRAEIVKVVAKSPRKLHASLALLPVDPGQVDYLYEWLLDAEPHEVPVIRDALALHRDALLNKLWVVVLTPDKGKERQRLRAAAVLAKYDSESERWAKVQEAVANDLVREPAVSLGTWMDAIRPLRPKLLTPLAAIFGDVGRRETERSLATDLLADYAADQPSLLAELVMDADAKQFAVIYPKFKEQSERGLPALEDELSKKVVAQTVSLRSIKEIITQKDPLVKIAGMKGFNSKPSKIYPVKMKAGLTYTMTMASIEVKALLVLQDNTGKQLDWNYGSGNGKSAVLGYTAFDNKTYNVYAASFQGTGSFSLDIVEMDAKEDAREKVAKRQANAALALFRMGRAETVWPLLKHSHDPRLRSYLVNRMYALGADGKTIFQQLKGETDIAIRRALLLSLGEYGEKDFLPEDRRALLENVKEIYCNEADPGLHASSEWLLRQWQEELWLKTLNDALVREREGRQRKIQELLTKGKEKTPQWYVNGQGQTLVVIPGPVKFTIGSPPTEAGRLGGASDPTERQKEKEIERHFAIASKEVTLGQFLAFKDHEYFKQFARTPECPMIHVSWYDATAYCNWLSEKEGIPEDQWCYKITGNETKSKPKYLQLTGYRLPTEAEWEYACRAGAETNRYYGESEELLGKYAWYMGNSQNRWLLPVGSLKPNDFGLFDMLGNAMEWCQGGAFLYVDGEDKENLKDNNSRVMRGGSFNFFAPFARSAHRDLVGPPSLRTNNSGFRPARTFTP